MTLPTAPSLKSYRGLARDIHTFSYARGTLKATYSLLGHRERTEPPTSLHRKCHTPSPHMYTLLPALNIKAFFKVGLVAKLAGQGGQTLAIFVTFRN